MASDIQIIIRVNMTVYGETDETTGPGIAAYVDASKGAIVNVIAGVLDKANRPNAYKISPPLVTWRKRNG